MRTNKFMIASLLILIGVGAITVSCEKEKTSCRKAKMITENDPEKTGGDEDPIIRVRVKHKNTLVAIDSALVETFAYGTNALANTGYTDSLGQYEHKVAAGIYYFHVTQKGSSTPDVTDTVRVSSNMQVDIFVN